MISVYVMYYGSSFKILLIEIVYIFSIDIQKNKNYNFKSKNDILQY